MKVTVPLALTANAPVLAGGCVPNVTVLAAAGSVVAVPPAVWPPTSLVNAVRVTGVFSGVVAKSLLATGGTGVAVAGGASTMTVISTGWRFARGGTKSSCTV